MDKFNEYIKKYQEDPYNVNVCRYLHMEYIKRGLEAHANEMKAHIERLGYKALEYPKPKKKNWWGLGCLGCLITIFIFLFFCLDITSETFPETYLNSLSLETLEKMKDRTDADIKDREAQLANPNIDAASLGIICDRLKELYALRIKIEKVIAAKH